MILINPIISNNKVSFGKLSKYKQSNPITFRGQLEDDYFESAKTNNIKGQEKALKNIGFNILEIDIETNSNFLHYALKSKNKVVINQALLLLSKKKKETALEVISQKDIDGKTPVDYTEDQDIIKRIEKITGKKIEIFGASSEVLNSQNNTNNTSSVQLNELPEGTEIFIPDLDDDINLDGVTDVDDLSNGVITPTESNTELQFIKLESIAGHNRAKDILLNRIVNPLKDGKVVTDNGFLIYGTIGKTFLLDSLSASLDRKVLNNELFDKTIEDLEKLTKGDEEKYKKGLADIFDKNIVKVSEIQDLEKVIELAQKNYKYNGKQAIILFDEIKGILPDVSAPYSEKVTKAEQLIENSAKKGFILVATTREKDAIRPESIRYGRFDKKIELTSPNQEERKQLISKYYKGNYQLSSQELENLAKITSGFTYVNFLEFLDNVENDEIDNYEILINKLKLYAKRQNLGELSESGTTANYDSDEFKRMPVAITFNDVAGMNDVKNKFKVNLIDKLKLDMLEWYKKQKRPPITSGFLLYGPPGTGKTYIAEAVAGETKIPMYKIDSSTIKDKFVGESDKKVRKLFRQLETKFEETGEYSILFIDEANSLLANRKKELSSNSLSSNSGDSELVNLFLQYLNKAPEKGIIPIVATNFKEEIDPAILDRLQTQIDIQLPDDELRAAMVEKELAKLPEYTKNITADEKKEIVVRLGGLSSRTINSILQKALDECSTHPDREMTLKDFTGAISNYALEHDLPEINEINRTSGYDGRWKRKVIKFPANFNDVAGMNDVKNIFQSTLIDRLKPDALERFKQDGNRKPIQSNFLLYGPPGTGKTFIAEALAGEMKIPLYELTSADIKAGLYGESEKNIKSIFDQLEKKYKKTGEYSILFVDEANDLFGSVKNKGQGGNTSLTNLFLERINNSAEKGIIVIAATNYQDQIEDAILSRLGKQIFIAPPDAVLRRALIEAEIKHSKSTANINNDDIDRLVKQTSGLSSRDITKIIKETINEHLTYSDTQISIDEFTRAINQFFTNNKQINNKTSLEKLTSIAADLDEKDLEDFIDLFIEYKIQKSKKDY